jgi:class 3 adenylate cyclase/tetratricopeptide (TPR) repeat protein
MRCASCHLENLAEAKFCGNCGASLKNRCQRCGTDNQPQSKFCSECGATLIESATVGAVSNIATTNATAETREALAGERRHLTVLFCDLVGSTEIASRTDPEEWRELVADYQRAAGEAITQYGGNVAKYLGDGVMAFFGYPEAHDNDVESAARAALAILDAIAKLNEQSARPKLSPRIGIHSGVVVVGAGPGQDTDVFGETPNIAARVQTAAEPSTVMITDAVLRLISGLFVVEERGAQTLKGIERPIRLYRVIRPSGVRGRLDAVAATRGLTPFVGREEELRLLMNRWERAREGEGQVALIIGEAGIGKSRLIQRFHEQIAATPHTWVEGATASFYQNTPFYPITEILRELSATHRDDSPDAQIGRLERALELAGARPAEAVPLLVPLLNLPLPPKYSPPVLSPEQQRRRLLATLVQWVLGAARAQPLVIVTEDLHWADPSTLELTELLVEQAATARMLLLYTARPEFRAQWRLRAHHTQITLNRLSVQNVRDMVLQVVAREALSEDTLAAVVHRTGGVPLFAEELTRVVLEGGDAKLGGRGIPATLHDSLMARLDRLGPAKELVQIASVIGSEFSYRLFHAVYPLGEQDLQRALRSLTNAELLLVRGLAPDATYQFRHALIRDAAYEALLKSRRKDLHGLVARTITEKFPALREEQPEVLARHWTEAGETELAIGEWLRAGKTAQARQAFREALESFRQAVELFDLLPESREGDLRELEIRQSLVQMLHLTRGYSAAESIEATRRAVALAQKGGNLRQLLNLMIARGVNALSAGDLPAAAGLADQALELALREGGSRSLFGRVHTLQMMVRYWRGDLAGVENHFAAGLEFFDDPSFKRVPGAPVIAFGMASLSAWTRGLADSARQRAAQMRAVVSGDSPYDMAFLGFLAAQLHIALREYGRAEASAAHALELSEEHHFPWLVALSRAALGHARAWLGRPIEGIALIRQGMAELLDTGSRFNVTNVVASLAEARLCNGAIIDALEAVEQALQANPDELVYRPEILRLRGELQLEQGHSELGEADFRQAITLARSMDAKAWELRATISLGRLLRDCTCFDEARVMVTNICSWFSEAADTTDLKDAQALLDELAISQAGL